MYFVYILKLFDNTFYKGQTLNLDARLTEHTQGNVKSTKGKLPIKLLHVELTNSRIEARNLEKYFKSGYGREIISEIDRIY